MSEIEKLEEKIAEANERLELLSDKGQIDPDTLYIEILGIDYVPNTFDLIVIDEDIFYISLDLCNYSGSSQEYIDLEVSEEYFNKYLDKLRRQCAETLTITFQEAEPEEYKEAKAAEEAMKHPDFKEVFEFSPDPKRDPFLGPILDFHNQLRKFASDNQELWWQQHGGEY